MELLTKKQVAEWFGVCQWTIDQWRRKKGLPFRSVGRVVRFDRSEVVAWFDTYTKGSVAAKKG